MEQIMKWYSDWITDYDLNVYISYHGNLDELDQTLIWYDPIENICPLAINIKNPHDYQEFSADYEVNNITELEELIDKIKTYYLNFFKQRP